ncbi:SRPBCC family protein [Amycolatopsis sp. NPDC005232]|uniref:SRPBCC family protein n=1 Tax=Amycolatopsis sp. NPDC005232 TaxID=3157027 RepID=UPI0033B2D2FF
MALISGSDRTVPVTVQARAEVGPATAFAVVVPIDLSVVFRRWGPFPGVRGVRNQTGPWDRVGASRNPDLTDGSTATEALTEYEPGHSFAYELTGFTNSVGRLVSGVRGEWTFTPDGDGTVIRWTYEFKPRPARHALIGLGLAPLWRRYMRSALTRTITAVESAAST